MKLSSRRKAHAREEVVVRKDVAQHTETVQDEERHLQRPLEVRGCIRIDQGFRRTQERAAEAEAQAGVIRRSRL
jgi:hypothetical protein